MVKFLVELSFCGYSLLYSHSGKRLLNSTWSQHLSGSRLESMAFFLSPPNLCLKYFNPLNKHTSKFLLKENGDGNYVSISELIISFVGLQYRIK